MATKFRYYSGPYECDDLLSTADAIVTGDALENDSGSLSPAASNERIAAVSLEANASAAITMSCLLITPGNTKIVGPRETATLAAGDLFDYWDLNSADGIDYDTSTNDDFFLLRRLSADLGVGYFAIPAYAKS